MANEADREAAFKALVFKGLSRDITIPLIEGASVRVFGRGETIFLQNDPAEFLFVVVEGWVKLFRVTPSGTEAVIGVFTGGDSFAEAPALLEGAYPVSAAAVTECRLLLVRGSEIVTLMARRPEVARAMLATTLTHLHGLVDQVEQLKAQSGAQRVAEFLISLAPVKSGPCTMTLPYDKALVAARLGMKPESLSRAFARLRSFGVNVPQNHVAIADVARLRAFSEEDRAAAWGREK